VPAVFYSRKATVGDVKAALEAGALDVLINHISPWKMSRPCASGRSWRNTARDEGRAGGERLSDGHHPHGRDPVHNHTRTGNATGADATAEAPVVYGSRLDRAERPHEPAWSIVCAGTSSSSCPWCAGSIARLPAEPQALLRVDRA
jgi:hypothetical protein